MEPSLQHSGKLFLLWNPTLSQTTFVHEGRIKMLSGARDLNEFGSSACPTKRGSTPWGKKSRERAGYRKQKVQQSEEGSAQPPGAGQTGSSGDWSAAEAEGSRQEENAVISLCRLPLSCLQRKVTCLGATGLSYLRLACLPSTPCSLDQPGPITAPQM